MSDKKLYRVWKFTDISARFMWLTKVQVIAYRLDGYYVMEA